MAIIHPHNDISSIHELFPKSLLKPIYRENLNIPPGYMGSKIPRGIGKSRMILSILTGQDCFDLEPGHRSKLVFLRRPSRITLLLRVLKERKRRLILMVINQFFILNNKEKN